MSLFDTVTVHRPTTSYWTLAETMRHCVSRTQTNDDRIYRASIASCGKTGFDNFTRVSITVTAIANPTKRQETLAIPQI